MGRHKGEEDLRSRSFPVAIEHDRWLDITAKEYHVSRSELVRIALSNLMENPVLIKEALQKKGKVA